MIPFKTAIIPVTLFKQNCSLIWEPDTMQAAVIDPGGEPGRIIDAINRLGLKVELILLTHGHLDHAGGAKALKGVIDAARTEAGESPVPLLGPDERDIFLLDSIEAQAAHFGMSGLRNVRPDRFLTEGEVIEFGNLRFEVLHTPGHTPGHIVFVERQIRFAFVGDTLFHGGIGRTDFGYGDYEALMAAIRDKLMPLGDDMSFIPGHGSGSTIGVERQSNPALQGNL